MKLLDSVRILNFDDSLIKQPDLLRIFRPQIIELKRIGLLSRHWLSQKTAERIRNLLSPDLTPAITFIGSGDFHHISYLLIEQFYQPLSVIVFDFHPDWDRRPPHLGCGSWVTAALKKNNIRKFILLGVSSDDISAPSIFAGNLAALKGDRLEIYPYLHKPTRCLFRDIPENVSLRVKKSLFFDQIYWQELRNKNLEDFFLKLIRRLPTKQVYVSIDKDCLKAEYALTNWEEGHFRLEDLMLMLRLIKENLDIVGLDIVGDYSAPKAAGMIKSIIAGFDHPPDFSAKGKPEELINAVNERTNIAILKLLLGKDTTGVIARH